MCGGMLQIDLRFEAVCLEQFVDNFEAVPNVRVPKVLRPYCKRDVLVETFEVSLLALDPWHAKMKMFWLHCYTVREERGQDRLCILDC